MSYNMASAVLMKGGLDTGFTAHGHHDFMLTDDVIHKVHIGHYTFYHKSIVKQPKNLIIAEDVFAQSYVSGEGTGLFPGAKSKERPAKNSFPDQLARDRFLHDIIPIWVPAGDHEIKNPLDITGAYSAQTLDMNNTTLDNSGEHYPNDTDYAEALQFDRLQNYGQPNEAFLSPMRHLNTICFRGHSLSYDPRKQTYSKITLNTGHWGPNVYPGCRAVRNGENAFLKDMEYEKARTAGQLGL